MIASIARTPRSIPRPAQIRPPDTKPIRMPHALKDLLSVVGWLLEWIESGQTAIGLGPFSPQLSSPASAIRNKPGSFGGLGSVCVEFSSGLPKCIQSQSN
jgi:hypothetical protein